MGIFFFISEKQYPSKQPFPQLAQRNKWDWFIYGLPIHRRVVVGGKSCIINLYLVPLSLLTRVCGLQRPCPSASFSTPSMVQDYLPAQAVMGHWTPGNYYLEFWVSHLVKINEVLMKILILGIKLLKSQVSFKMKTTVNRRLKTI